MINNDLTNSCMFDYPDTSDLGETGRSTGKSNEAEVLRAKNESKRIDAEIAQAKASNDLQRIQILQQAKRENDARLWDLINSATTSVSNLLASKSDAKVAKYQARTAEAQARMAAGMTPSSSFNIKNLALPLLGLAAVGLVVFVAKKRS